MKNLNIKTLKIVTLLLIMPIFGFGCASNGGTNMGMGEILTIGAMAAGANALSNKSQSTGNNFVDAFSGTTELSRTMGGLSDSMDSLGNMRDSYRNLTNTDIEYDADRNYRTEIGKQKVRDLSSARTNQRNAETRSFKYRDNQAYKDLAPGQVIKATDSRYVRDYGFATPNYGNGNSGGSTGSAPAQNGSCLHTAPVRTTYRNGMCYTY